MATRSGIVRLGALALAGALAAASCSSNSTSNGSTSSGGTTGTTASASRTLKVPQDYPTIQKAVDAAKGGDLVLISPGVYKEEVVVQTENIVIRGLDRNEVILDGEFTRDNGIKAFSNGVAVENLTARNYKGNGVFFTGDYDSKFTLTGYRASYVTAHNNGDYGIYGFNATKGQIDNSYGSGHPDSAFYIGQCEPCDAVIIDSLAEWNMLGYSGTNSSDLVIARSEWRHNMIGIVPNSQDGEKLAPQERTTIVGNWIHDNTSGGVPITSDDYRLAWGIGVVVTGGVDNIVERNLLQNNPRGGIVVILWPFRKEGLPPFEAIGNKVRDNVIEGTQPDGLGDMGLWLADSSQGTQGNCFEGNTYTRSFPPDVEKLAPCSGPTAKDLPGIDLSKLNLGPDRVDYKTVKAPPPQPNMPDAATAPALPATPDRVPMKLDLASIKLPEPKQS